MNCAKLSGSIALAAVLWAGLAPAAVPPSSDSSSLRTVVIRGSSETAASSASGNDDSPAVLRGSTPSAAPPAVATPACPPDYLYEPPYGCVPPGYASAPDDYGYWPYYWGDGFYFSPRHPRFHGFRPGLVDRAGRGLPARFDRRPANGFGAGVASTPAGSAADSHPRHPTRAAAPQSTPAAIESRYRAKW
jgi:hypothetical protein